MILLSVVGSLLCGLVLGYALHYFRFEHNNRVLSVEKENKRLARDNEDLANELESVRYENIMIKKEGEVVLNDNQEFQDIIAQLSIYAKHMKQCIEHVAALEKLTQVYDDNIHERIQNIVDAGTGSSYTTHDNKKTQAKHF